MDIPHLHEELHNNPGTRVTVSTRCGDIVGGRATTGAAVFLEVPYALPPGRFQDPKPLPDGHRYKGQEFISEASYAVQPTNDGQAQGNPFEDKVGRGEPTENPLFLNIVVPPSFPQERNFPVRVYIHGGFLQFGSPHGLSSQAQYIAEERKEIWVNIGYRVSAFGFLASDTPKLDGNYGFKDQWLALTWIRDNIKVFGGNPEDMWLSGLSAGAHSVHQILHHVSQLPPGEKSPFQVAVLQSNALLADPKTPEQLRSQFETLCHGLGLDSGRPDILDVLMDPKKVPWQSIVKVIEDDTSHVGTFRGCLSKDWMITSPGPMERQRSGAFSNSLRERGINAIVVGDLTEEWYLYSIAHPIDTKDDILPNLNRYFPDDISRQLLLRILPKKEQGNENRDVVRLFGDVLSIGQVHFPVRLLARDLLASNFPVLRYEIGWTPEDVRPEGYVTHGTDRFLWALRKLNLDSKQWQIAKEWVKRIGEEVEKMLRPDAVVHEPKAILTLKEDQSIGWTNDRRWDELMGLLDILPGEGIEK